MGKKVNAGTQATIFNVEKTRNRDSNQDIVVKFSNNYKAIAHEIKVLHKIEKNMQQSETAERSGFP